MYKECKTTQSAKRQIEIAKELSEMMATRQYDEISVSDLCKKADIPRKSFYRYFDTKDDAFNFLVDKVLVDGHALDHGNDLMGDTINKDMLARKFEYFKEHRALIGAIANNRMSLHTIQRVSNTIVAQMRDFGSKVSMEDEMKIAMITSVVFAVIMSWHHSDYAVASEELAETTYTLLTKPLVNPNGE